MSSLGETLRQARLDKGVSLEEAEQETRIRRRYLEALENEELASLPAPVYARGIIRSYARYLGLPPEAMVDLYQSIRPKEERLFIRSATSYEQKQSSVPTRLVAVLAGVALMAVFLWIVWSQYSALAESIQRVQEREISRTLTAGLESPVPAGTVAAASQALSAGASPTPAPPPSPTPSPTPTPEPPPIEGIVIEARIVGPTLMEVWVDGQKVLSENLAAGTSRSFQANRSLRMRVSDGAAVEVTENAIPRGPLDPSGRPVEVHWTRG